MSDAELERDLQQLSGVAAGRAWTERVHVCGERDGGERRGEEKIKVHGVRGSLGWLTPRRMRGLRRASQVLS